MALEQNKGDNRAEQNKANKSDQSRASRAESREYVVTDMLGNFSNHCSVVLNGLFGEFAFLLDKLSSFQTQTKEFQCPVCWKPLFLPSKMRSFPRAAKGLFY